MLIGSSEGKGYRQIKLTRDVSPEEVEKQRLGVMPGFRFVWWYSGKKVIPDIIYRNYKRTEPFVR